MRYLYGIHDPGGEHLMLEAGRPGWVVVTEEIGADPRDRSGRDYRYLSDRGLGVIVRLNHGYGATGTIPEPARYPDFAARCGAFAAASRGCTRWIVGNEPNHSQERPGGQVILPEQYAACLRGVQRAIKQAQAGAEVICAAVAPWNVESGDWIGYFRSVLANCDPDGLALHAYTHGPAPALVASEIKMSAPFESRRRHLRAYRDFLDAVPLRLRHLPVHITEANQGDGPWVDANTGWVQAAYAEIAGWNALPGAQKIHCLCLYRWPAYDRWSFGGKPGVVADFRAAMQRGHLSPATTESPIADGSGGANSTQYIPVVAGGGAETQPPAAPPRRWDERLTQRGVRVVEADARPGQSYWRVVRGEWLDEGQSQGRHHIYVDVRDEAGRRIAGAPLKILWPSGTARIVTEEKPGEPYGGNFPMSSSRNEFQVLVDTGAPSDAVIGIGMGAETPGGFNAGIHTSTAVVFQRTEAPKTAQEPPKHKGGTDAPKTPETPVLPVPAPVGGALEPWALAAVLAVESGGKALGGDGQVIIRFENHIFASRLNDAALYAAHFSHDRDKPWTGHNWRPAASGPWRPVHTGRQADERAAYAFAAMLNPEAAAQALGMGIGQVMGFNHGRLGFASAMVMLDAFAQGEAMQIIGAINYVLSDAALARAVNAHDWRTVARLYNGSGQIDYYAGLLEQAYRRLTGG